LRGTDESGGSGAQPGDAALVAAFQRDPHGAAGRAAAERLLGRYRQRVLLWCWQVLRDRDAALDTAQEVLISAYRGLDGYRDEHRFGAWLFTIARNRCRGELRRRRVPLAGEAVLALVADEEPRPDQTLERKEREAALMALVRTELTPLEQDALWLRCDEGLAVAAITARLGITEKTGARAVLQRARRKLRRALARGEPEADPGGAT
jgi:RNA polymerase sigma-70 factor (ECF subfamily)